MRATVPVYDVTGQFMIGYSARSINDKCPMCNTYHYFKHPCPRNKIEETYARKWRHSEGFSTGNTLYNIWNVNSPNVILVEGPGDVWRLDECGCNSALSIFGCNITNAQIQQLAEKNVQNVTVCLDNDKAGIEGAEKVYEKLKMYFNVEVIKTNQKDVGDSSISEVQDLLKGSRWKLLE
jgi:DNA primase